MNIYARTIRYFRPFVWATAGGVALTLANIGFNLLKPWPFKFIVDGVLDKTAGTAETRALIGHWMGAAEPSVVILWLCLAMVLISLIGGLINLASNYLFVHVGLQALLKLRTDLYSALQALPLKFHDSRRSADSSFRVAYDSQSIQTIYNKGFATVLSSVVMLVTVAVVVATRDLAQGVLAGVLAASSVGAGVARRRAQAA